MAISSIISEKSLMPISLAFTACAFAFWVAGVSKDVESTAHAVTRIQSERSSVEAELLSQLRSASISINEIERMQAVHNSQMSMVLKMLDRGIER